MGIRVVQMVPNEVPLSDIVKSGFTWRSAQRY